VCYQSFVFSPYFIASIRFAIIIDVGTFESVDFRILEDCSFELLLAIIIQNHHLSSFIAATGTATLPIHLLKVQVAKVCFRTALLVFIYPPVFGNFRARAIFTVLLCCY